ncbi:MAG: DUF4263 domain-containing protein, partial [Hadesarchaea archaeon]|nr:DUF4263 domain-containing protein [Hadesarchaea archaeon]
MALHHKYQTKKDAPPAMEWGEYEKLINTEWRKLLSASNDEEKFQKFLEQYPCLLPGAFGFDGRSGHMPFPGAVITKPPLPGIGPRIPDFLWIATDSDSTCPILIELESPSKQWFTNSGMQSAELTRA